MSKLRKDTLQVSGFPERGNLSAGLVILSGGLDSTVLTYDLVHRYGAKNLIALTFNYGQKNSPEISMARRTCRKLGLNQILIDTRFVAKLVSNQCALVHGTGLGIQKVVRKSEQPNTYVPFRNAFMAITALMYAETHGVNNIFLGIQRHDLYRYWDCEQEFVTQMQMLIAQSGSSIWLNAPYLKLSKAEEIKIGLELGVPFEDTWTCYNPDRAGKRYKACGLCGSCQERELNFKKAKIADPVA